MRMNAVPSKAESARKTKKEARFGARAVDRLSKKNMTAVNMVTCTIQYVTLEVDDELSMHGHKG